MRARFVGLALVVAGFSVHAAGASDIQAVTSIQSIGICNAFGDGDVVVPGTATCLSLYGDPLAHTHPSQVGITPVSDKPAVRARAAFRYDRALDTQSMARWSRMRRVGGVGPHSGAYNDGGLALAPPSQSAATAQDAPLPDFMQSYLQIGNVRLGRSASAFNVGPNYSLGEALPALQRDIGADVLSYTVASDTGFAATVALENNPRLIDPLGDAQAFAIANDRDTDQSTLPDDQSTLPDIVASLAIGRDWGSAQIAGAVHPLNRIGESEGSALGWAVAGGMTLNLPFLAANDELSFQAVYSDGALVYNGIGNTLPGISTTDAHKGVDGEIETSKALSLSGGLLHNWSPHLSGSISGAYVRVDQPENQAQDLNDFGAYNIKGNLLYKPVDDLIIGAELGYQHVDVPGKQSDGSVGAALRVKRDF